jgi:hypothetical protein
MRMSCAIPRASLRSVLSTITDCIYCIGCLPELRRLGPILLSLDPVSLSYRETAALASRSEGGRITASNAGGSVRNARLSPPSTIGITRRARFDKIEVTTQSSGHATMVAGVGAGCFEIEARRWT